MLDRPSSSTLDAQRGRRITILQGFELQRIRAYRILRAQVTPVSAGLPSRILVRPWVPSLTCLSLSLSFLVSCFLSFFRPFSFYLFFSHLAFVLVLASPLFFLISCPAFLFSITLLSSSFAFFLLRPVFRLFFLPLLILLLHLFEAFLQT